MERLKDLAIVLRTVAYEERHKIVTALTETQGKVSLMAKNSVHSRRFGSALEVFTAGQWMFTRKPGSELAYLEETVIRREFAGLRADFNKLSAASFLSEIVSRVALPFQNCSELFKLHSNGLVALEEFNGDSNALEILISAYLAKTLRWIGSFPSLDACLGCHRSYSTMNSDERIIPDAERGGLWCSECVAHGKGGHSARSGHLTASRVILLQEASERPIRDALKGMKDISSEDLLDFVYSLFAFHVPGFDRTEPKSLRFLRHAPKN